MAEHAHGASGPASSEPAGIVPQQGSGPDKGKLRVFISYSRDDLKFADQLDAALDMYGFECVIDRHGISGGEDWKRRLGNLISEADTVVFVLSPSSARSETCAWEVAEAERLNKRIIPIIAQPLGDTKPPAQLRERNYIYFYEDPRLPGSGFGTGLVKLVTALNTDFDWLREHTRYLQRAIEWDKGGRPANRLLSGNDIAEAKAWAARRPKDAPEPTALHLNFIRASEEEAEARLSEQRKQLEAMAAAQAERETALHDREEALKQRARIARVRNIALVAVSILALLAVSSTVISVWSYRQAQHERIVAEQQKQEAVQQKLVAEQQTQKAEQQKLVAEQQKQEAEQQKQRAVQLSSLRIKAEAWGAKRDDEPGYDTAERLSEVIRVALFAKKFQDALTVANFAHLRIRDNLELEAYRAHALLFTGRGGQAKAIYFSHKGERVREANNQLWEQVIAEGFADFRKAGLTHPMMADIEKGLGISPDGNADIRQR